MSNDQQENLTQAPPEKPQEESAKEYLAKKVKPRETVESKKRKRKAARTKSGRLWRNNWAGKTEEQKRQWRENIQKAKEETGNRGGRIYGMPNGWTKNQWELHLLMVKWCSKRYVEEIIKDNELDRNNPDDRYAIEAIETAVNLMRMQAPLKDKLAATKLVLEFTKAKPSTKSEVTLNSAEDFLANVLKEEEKKG